MTTGDPLQQNIRRTAGQHALMKMRAIVDEDNGNDADDASRYAGCCATAGLLVVGASTAHLTGVY
jgi:hypothetical protein